MGWSSQNQSLYVATRRPHEAFSAPQQLATNSIGTPPDVAVNPAGAAVVAWFASGNATDAYGGVRAAYRLPGGAKFEAPENLAIATSPDGDVFTAIADDGTAVVADGASAFFGARAGTSLAVRPPVGSFGPPQAVGDGSTISALAAEPGGGLSLVFSALSAGQPAGVTLVGRSASGALTGPVALTSDPQACAPEAASSPAGDLLVTWSRPCNGGSERGAQLVLRRAPTAPFDAPIAVDSQWRGDPALTGTGEGIVTFNRNQYSASSMAFEDLDRPVPPLPTEVQIDARSLVLPRGGELGLRVRCPVRCKVRPTGILITSSRLTASKPSKMRRLKAKKRTRVLVRFSRARVSTARRALRHGERVTLSYTVTTSGRSARALTQSRMVRLRTKR